MPNETWPAGTYELVADQWDERVSPLDKPFASVRHRKGDEVKLNSEDADRLGRGGAIQKPGEAQRNVALAAKAQYEAALAALPPELRDEVLGRRDADKVAAKAAENAGDGQTGNESPDPSTAVTSQPPTTEGGAAQQPPPRSAKQSTWVDFAVAHRGANRDEIKDTPRDELAARYGNPPA